VKSLAYERSLSRAVTAAVYGRSARKFARRHAQAGGKAYSYLLSWRAPGNIYGAAHTVDLPLLFGDKRSWERFADGDGLGRRGEIPGTLRYRSV
jgi:para-nitrobenzyl esterase